MREIDGLLPLYAYARELEPTGAEIQRALRRSVRPVLRRRRQRMAAAVALFAALLTTVVAAPGSAAIRGSLGSLESFLSGGATPGSTPALAQYPGWLSDVERLPVDVAARTGPTPNGARLLAERGGEKLYAYRQRGDGAVCFAFGHHVTSCDPDAGNWRRRLDNHAAAVLMTAPSSDGTAVYGIAQSDAATVQVSYATGAASEPIPVTNSAFVLIVDTSRTPTSLIVYATDGSQLDRVPLADRQWKFCAQAGPGCG